MNNTKVELPIVTETTTEGKHPSILLVTDGLRQADENLKEQEANIKRLTDQLQNLHSLRIATMAQRNLLAELQTKITELEQLQVQPTQAPTSQETAVSE
jgi:hypothetical protein